MLRLMLSTDTIKTHNGQEHILVRPRDRYIYRDPTNKELQNILGLDKFSLDKFSLDKFSLDKFSLDKFSLDKFRRV